MKYVKISARMKYYKVYFTPNATRSEISEFLREAEEWGLVDYDSESAVMGLTEDEWREYKREFWKFLEYWGHILMDKNDEIILEEVRNPRL